ncbi:hypothetical protein HAX54_000739, partial [Datura stramonium]|nr:hypothetical protein [Datura stramonium]
MVQHNTFSNPLNGKAFVIFKSSEAAETATTELKRRCLMLGDGRPVVAQRGTIPEPVKSRGFPGHLSIGKIKFQKLREEMSNTIEHEMAVEWRVLQENSSRWWKALHQKQAEDMEHLSSKLKNPIQNSGLVLLVFLCPRGKQRCEDHFKIWGCIQAQSSSTEILFLCDDRMQLLVQYNNASFAVHCIGVNSIV